MRNLFVILSLFACWAVRAHVPALLLPIKGTPIASYFIGQSDVSRAVYSELAQSQNYFVLQFYVKELAETSIEIFTPVCPQVPSYEEFQPSVLLLKGDLAWKENAESNKDFISRLETMAISKAESSYLKGNRPQFFEEFGNQSYWVGGKVRKELEAGLYALVVYNRNNLKGNFTIGINEKESWTPDLFKYVGELLPKISVGICNPRGFSGSIEH